MFAVAASCITASCITVESAPPLAADAGAADGATPSDASAATDAPGDAGGPSTDAAPALDAKGPSCAWTSETTGTTAAGSFGDGSWLNAAAALAADGVEAAADVGKPAKSLPLILGGYTFAVPSNATVQGIELTVTRRAADGTVGDESVQLLRGGMPFPTSKAKGAWKSSTEKVVYGDKVDLWGASANAPTPSELSSLGVSIRVEHTAAIGDSTAFIDAATLRVYYCQ